MTGLCTVYACDVLSFLRFPQLEQCRLVSRAYNFTITTNSTRLPARRRLQMAIISVEGAGSVEFTREGYVVGEDLRVKRLQAALQDCCDEELKVSSTSVGVVPQRDFAVLKRRVFGSVQEAAHSIAGELIFHHCAQTDRVEISIFPRPGWDSMTFAARNELTRETALGLLHLFEHLRYTYFHYLGIIRKSNSAGQMNQAIFKLLSRPGDQYKFRVQTMPGSSLHAEYWRRDLPLRIRQCEWCLNIDGIARMLDFALRARRHCDCIFSRYTDVAEVIEVLEHLQSTLSRIGTDTIRTWRFNLGSYRMHADDLPDGIRNGMMCEEVMDYSGHSIVLYSRRLTNQHSGEQFKVVFKCMSTRGGVDGAYEVEFDF